MFDIQAPPRVFVKCVSRIPPTLKLPWRIFLKRMMLRYEFTIVGEKSMGKFMKNCEPLTLWHTALAIFNL